MDLTKILKAGDKVYSLITDKVSTIQEIDLQNPFPILVGTARTGRRYNRFGSVLIDGKDCLIFPDKQARSWDNYCGFKKGQIVYAHNEGGDNAIGVFSHKAEGMHYLFASRNGDEIQFSVFQFCEFFNP